MSVKYHKSLQLRRATLKKSIEQEQRSPRPDWVRLRTLKKLRLALKDRLHALLRSSTFEGSAQPK